MMDIAAMKPFLLISGSLLLSLSLLTSLSSSAIPGDGRQGDYNPPVSEGSNEGERAMGAFRVPEGMEAELIASEPLLANPVAFCFDEKGRVYIAETFRQKKGVEDNRSHMDWLLDDLAAESVADRVAYFKKHLGEKVADYAKEHDRIRVLEDVDGDGKMDRTTVFADGFNAIEDGTGAGVLAIDGDLYYTCIPKLYRLSDTNDDGAADVREALHDGFGVRVAFRGHDMHGLTLGPDGRVYFSIGDRGYNVITQEGIRLKRPDTGAVFRCELDGSNLEEFAYGLRNPQELAFDNFGNLFTGDNNSDSGDKARWVYVVQGGDSGWRMYYQYLSDRGPWNRERMWYPYRDSEETKAIQPAYIIPPIANLGDGPSGLTFYPGVGLSKQYDDHFFMADFRGASPNSGIRSFANKAKGATFELVDSKRVPLVDSRHRCRVRLRRKNVRHRLGERLGRAGQRPVVCVPRSRLCEGSGVARVRSSSWGFPSRNLPTCCSLLLASFRPTNATTSSVRDREADPEGRSRSRSFSFRCNVEKFLP